MSQSDGYYTSCMKRQGISEMIATIILIVIVIAGAAVIYPLANRVIGNGYVAGSSAISAAIQSQEKQFTVAAGIFNSTTIALVINNYGNLPISFQEVAVNGKVSPYSLYSTSNSAITSIPAQTLAFMYIKPALAPADGQVVFIATTAPVNYAEYYLGG